MLIGLFALGYVGRYLEIAGFGALNFALTLTMLFSSIATLGIDGVVIRELVSQPERRDEILGTAFVLRIIGAFAAIAVVTLSALAFRSSGAPLHLLVILSLAFLPQSFDVIDLWFQKNIQAKFTVVAKTTAAITGALVRIGLAHNHAPLWTFGAAAIIEACVFGAGLVTIFHRNGLRVRAWRFAPKLAALILGNSWPLIISGLTVAIYQRIETFLVWDWLGASAAGVYFASQNIFNLWGTIPALLLPTLYPLLIEQRKQDTVEYERRVQSVFDLLTAAGLVIAIAGVVIAPFVVSLIFGAKYNAAIPILMIQSCATPFTFSGSVRGLFLVMENLNMYSAASAAVGIAANVTAAIFLMPHFGARGAALGALIGYAVSAVVTSWLFAKLHPCARYQTRSLFILLRLPSAYADIRRFV